MSGTLFSAPWETLVFCLALLVMPIVASTSPRRGRVGDWLAGLQGLAIVGALFAMDGPSAYASTAIGALLHAVGVGRRSRTGAAALLASALLSVAIAVCLAAQQLTAAFLLSILNVAIRAGAMPFNGGIASLCDRAPDVLTQQLASTIALVFVHLRFVDHHPEAIALAPMIVRYGAAAALAGALMSTVQRDLRGFLRSTTAVHGGMAIAALGAASLHNYAAALMVIVSAGLGLGGLALMIGALEARVGPVRYGHDGGRAQAFPRLAAAFALFGGASVAMPGTVGFVADDLLLHVLWMESPVGTVAVILSSAMLAVSTLICFAAVFLGRPRPFLAPDLTRGERVAAVALVVLLLGLGLAPGALLYPADSFLEVPAAIADVRP